MRSAEFIGWALGGLEREIAQTRERLASLTEQAAHLRKRAGRTAGRAGAEDAGAAAVTPGSVGQPGNRKRRRRNMSAEARKRISDMMKKRWADYRKQKKSA